MAVASADIEESGSWHFMIVQGIFGQLGLVRVFFQEVYDFLLSASVGEPDGTLVIRSCSMILDFTLICFVPTVQLYELMLTGILLLVTLRTTSSSLDHWGPDDLVLRDPLPYITSSLSFPPGRKMGL